MSGSKALNMRFSFSTKGEMEFIDLTGHVQKAVAKARVRNGFVHVFAPHATGVLILTESDYSLLEDIRAFLEKVIPKHENYRHPSNAFAHLRSMLLSPDKTIPVIEEHVEFGKWQSLMFVEKDVHPRRRTVIMQVAGEQ